MVVLDVEGSDSVQRQISIKGEDDTKSGDVHEFYTHIYIFI